jgi:hypothetical protein
MPAQKTGRIKPVPSRIIIGFPLFSAQKALYCGGFGLKHPGCTCRTYKLSKKLNKAQALQYNINDER